MFGIKKEFFKKLQRVATNPRGFRTSRNLAEKKGYCLFINDGGPQHPIRELTADEQERHAGHGYAMYEEYPEEKSPLLGKFWTQVELDRHLSGCRVVTTMGRALAETYARDPQFYGGTFCTGCGTHFPVGEFLWQGTTERVGS